MGDDVEVKVALDPGRVGVFGSLVDGEGDGSDECDTSHWSHDAWGGIMSVICQVKKSMVLQSTSKEPSQLLSVVGMTNAVQKTLVMIRLHACLDTIQRKGRKGRKDT